MFQVYETSLYNKHETHLCASTVLKQEFFIKIFIFQKSLTLTPQTNHPPSMPSTTLFYFKLHYFIDNCQIPGDLYTDLDSM